MINQKTEKKKAQKASKACQNAESITTGCFGHSTRKIKIKYIVIVVFHFFCRFLFLLAFSLSHYLAVIVDLNCVMS